MAAPRHTLGQPPAARLACVDIGSNTTRLLVADRLGDRLVEVHQERAFTRIGRAVAGTGVISEEKIAEVVAVVAAQLAIAADLGATGVRGVATAAIRGAVNGPALVEAIRRASGLAVEVLSPGEEARLAFVGAAAMLDSAPAGALGVVDVGGGSTELIVGAAPDRVDWWTSVELGSGALADRCLGSDPPTAGELADARLLIADALAGLAPPRPLIAVAVGGSATSLSRVAGRVLDAQAVDRALAVLAGKSSIEVAARFDVDRQRARLLPAGLLILEAVAALLDAPLEVGRGGIREGVLLEAVQT
ncbi:MAG: Ppx/GppA phosphatase family protein [Solirubrobacteraceae bacterium]